MLTAAACTWFIRLWAGFSEYSGSGTDLDAYARLRPTETAVVVLEPRR
jgi:hypothetical protein